MDTILGSENSLISYIGVRTLESVAKAQQHKTIGDLLRANVDYFSYHILMKLRQVTRNPGVLNVIEVVMKYSRLDFLPHLKGIVKDVFRQLCMPYHQKDTYSFLKIFHTFIACVKTLISWENTKGIIKKDTQSTNNFSETIILSLLEYYNAKKIEDEKIENNVEEMESDADMSNFEELTEETNTEQLTEDYSDPNAEGIYNKNLYIYKFYKYYVNVLHAHLFIYFR